MQRRFQLKPSSLLTFSIVCAHAVVMGTLFFIPLPSAALIPLLVVLSGSMVYYTQRDARLKSGAACVALYLDDERVVLINRKGDELSGRLHGGSVVTPYLVVLNVEVSEQRCKRNVLIMPDSMDAESFRQLRVALRWGGAVSA